MSLYLLELGNRVTALESNHLTAADGQEIWKDLGRKANLAEVPPLWIQDIVKTVQGDVNEIYKELSRVRALMDTRLGSPLGGQ